MALREAGWGFVKGQRVLAGASPGKPKRLGTVVGFSLRKPCVIVLHDGIVTPTTYHHSFVWADETTEDTK